MARVATENHSTKREIWISTTKSPDGLQYLDAVEEALCFGWIDSTIKAGEGVMWRRFSPRLTMSTTLWCATAGCRTTPLWWWEWWLPAPTATASRQPSSTSKSNTCPTSVAWSGWRRTRSRGNRILLHKRYFKSKRYTHWKSILFFLRKWLIFTIFGVYLQSLRVRITRARA